MTQHPRDTSEPSVWKGGCGEAIFKEGKQEKGAEVCVHLWQQL